MKLNMLFLCSLIFCSLLPEFIFADDDVMIIPVVVEKNKNSKPTYDVPHKTMTIDGNFIDWSTVERFNLDINAGDCNHVSGRIIRYLYITQDEDYIYMRMILNGPLDPTFRPKFGHGQMHVRVNPPPYATLSLSSPICGGPFPNGLLEFNDDLSSFEIRFDKCAVALWHTDRLAAWNDQDSPSICRYYTDDFPVFNIDFSKCGF